MELKEKLLLEAKEIEKSINEEEEKFEKSLKINPSGAKILIKARKIDLLLTKVKILNDAIVALEGL